MRSPADPRPPSSVRRILSTIVDTIIQKHSAGNNKHSRQKLHGKIGQIIQKWKGSTGVSSCELTKIGRPLGTSAPGQRAGWSRRGAPWGRPQTCVDAGQSGRAADHTSPVGGSAERSEAIGGRGTQAPYRHRRKRRRHTQDPPAGEVWGRIVMATRPAYPSRVMARKACCRRQWRKKAARFFRSRAVGGL